MVLEIFRSFDQRSHGGPSLIHVGTPAEESCSEGSDHVDCPSCPVKTPQESASNPKSLMLSSEQ